MTVTVARWQEWASFALGLWLAVSPWVAHYAEHEAATANAVFLGLSLALGAHFQASLNAVRGGWLMLVAGLWLIAAPFALGFHTDPVPTATSISVGGFVVLLARSGLSLYREEVH